MYNYTTQVAFNAQDYLNRFASGCVSVIYTQNTRALIQMKLPKIVTESNSDQYAYALFFFQNGSAAEKKKSCAIFKKLSAQGFLPAMNAYATCLFDGVGVSKDVGEAMRLYKEAASCGYAIAEYNLGYSILNDFSEGDYLDGMCHVLSAAHAGYSVAQHAVGSVYAQGKYGYPQDERTARKWFVKAAENLNMKSCVWCGLAHLTGKGTYLDTKKGLQYLNTAVEYDYVPAMEILGKQYFYGSNVAKNYYDAFRYFERAAELGSGEAMYYLAARYAEGYDCYPNMERSNYWMQKSADAGYEAAKKILKR